MKKPYWKTSRNEHISGSRPLALLVLLIGLLVGLYFNPLIGLLIFIAGACLDSKYKRRHLCCYCGNTVSPTSLICPTCGADESTAIAEAEAEKAEKARAAALKKHPHLLRK
jgi:hypothetical protein